jgi:hypothetical protein
MLTIAIPILGAAALIVLWRAPAMQRPEAASPSTSVPLTTVTAAPTTTSSPAGPPFYRSGVLPDGTEFQLNSDSEPIGPIEGASATIMIDLEDPPPGAESTMVFGVVEYLYLPTEFRDYGRGFVLLPAGDWTVRVEIPDSAMALVGDEAPAMLLAGVEVSPTPRVSRERAGTGRVDVPVLTLAPPFRWASDAEGAVPMEVSTAEFVVRRGCGVSALSCGGTRGIQVTARRATQAIAGDGPVVSIESWDVARPTTDGFYLDPGPLGFRSEPHVIWTGREMIVWGGRSSANYQEALLMGGAAFDPLTSQWRVLPEPPLVGPDLTAVVWADDRMIMISRQATLAYDPDSDEWTRLGDGPQYGPRSPGLTVWTGEVVATWAPLGIRVFDPAIGTWTTLPDPGFGGPDRWQGALRVIDGRLYAVGSGLLVVAEWTGSEWRRLPDPPGVSYGTMEPASSTARSGVVDGRLIVWGGEVAFAYDPATDNWSQIAAPPYSSHLFWDVGLLEIDERLLLPLGHNSLVYDDATDQMVRVASVIYDSATDRWESVVLPGDGNETQMVWTGEEVLSWGGCCWGAVTDAWRWRPPEG